VGDALQNLLRFTGYPEPFAAGTESFYKRWRDNHISLILQEDLRDLTKIAQVRKLETLLYLLPERVGTPLSLNALRQPLESAHGSIRLWLDALKVVYLLFSIGPWTARLSRSILKEEKYYFWDWGMLDKPGARFENFVAVQLQRAISAWNEQGKGPFKLYYLRTKDGAEVDFAVADQKKLFLLVEVKEKETGLTKTLPFFQEKLGVGLAVRLVNRKGLCVQKGKGLYVMGADRFFSLLP
jgi:predicted AAA+ superfamily ATPase